MTIKFKFVTILKEIGMLEYEDKEVKKLRLQEIK